MALNGNRLKPPTGLETKDGVCRMVVMGSSGVGKTALTVRFLTKRFIGEYCPTLESIYQCHTRIDDEDARFEILDTAGQASDYWKDGYSSWGDCFLFIYSITDRSSYHEILQLKSQIAIERMTALRPTVIVANKVDLLHDRQVKEEEGMELARAIGCKFCEVSAADWTQVDEITEMFYDLYRDHNRIRMLRDGRHRKVSPSNRFRHAIQKVMSGKPSNRKDVQKIDQRHRGRHGSFPGNC